MMACVLHHACNVLSTQKTTSLCSRPPWKPSSSMHPPSKPSIFFNSNKDVTLALTLPTRPHGPQKCRLCRARARARATTYRTIFSMAAPLSETRDDEEHDVIVIGSGIGGLVASTQLAIKGARVLLLEKYNIPGGSSGFYRRNGYTFDVGSSVMFGCGDKVRVLCLPLPQNHPISLYEVLILAKAT